VLGRIEINDLTSKTFTQKGVHLEKPQSIATYRDEPERGGTGLFKSGPEAGWGGGGWQGKGGKKNED